jgi:ketosteroid isomerase-like protein
MKVLTYLIVTISLITGCQSSPATLTAADRESFSKTLDAFKSAFANGDVQAILALHHPDIVKYFGGDNVVKGLGQLGKGLTQTFQVSKLEFAENKLENTLYVNGTIIETRIFMVKITPKNGGKPSYARDRSMVTCVRYKNSPYGWASIREMVRAAPDEK